MNYRTDNVTSRESEHEVPGEEADGRSVRARELREERRARILSAARKLFAERGYDATSITDLIDEAGIARGTFYLYFENKRAIFADILDDLFRRLKETLKPIQTGPDDPPVMQQLNGNLERVLGILLEDRSYSQILARTGMGIDPDFDQKLGEFYGAVASLIHRALVKGQSMGLLRTHNPDLVAQFIVGGIRQAIISAHIEGRTMPVPEFVSEIVRYNLEGLLKR